MTSIEYPSFPLNTWAETKTTLHLFTQIIGKVRMALMPKMNHWWHVPFYLSPRGLTTSAISYQGRSMEFEFNFLTHELKLDISDGDSVAISLEEITVAEFYDAIFRMLENAGININIVSKPFDSERVKSEVPFSDDTIHGTYERDKVRTFWKILLVVDSIFKEFRGRYLGKCSPVHFFWHSFDLAVTRFSGREATVAPDADPVTREAYSHEVISAGFWFGDEMIPEPAFYTYAFPEPAGLARQPLRPDNARWQESNGSHMALYKYDDFRKAAQPRDAALLFLQSAYDAAARLAQWPAQELTA